VVAPGRRSNLLVDDAVLEKRRGIGMFVAAGACEQLRAARRKPSDLAAGTAPCPGPDHQ
jgi:hypothetical protein